jgi:hypothetical protein
MKHEICVFRRFACVDVVDNGCYSSSVIGVKNKK